MIANYGSSILINVFFGTVVNAAQAIANQVSAQLGVFATTLIRALNPMIDKSEGAGNRNLMLKTTMMGSKVSFFLLMVMYIPFLIETPFVLKLWLNKVPDFAVLFCQFFLISFLIQQLFIPVASAISAEGNIKGYQISSSILAFLPLPVSYILFKLHYPAYTLYVVYLLFSIVVSSLILYYAKKNCQLPLGEFFSKAVYGLPEIYRDRIATADLVGCAGCYPTASLLALQPLLKQGLVEPSTIVIDAKSGTSGGGRQPLTYYSPKLMALSQLMVLLVIDIPLRLRQICSDLAGQEVLALQFTPLSSR